MAEPDPNHMAGPQHPLWLLEASGVTYARLLALGQVLGTQTPAGPRPPVEGQDGRCDMECAGYMTPGTGGTAEASIGPIQGPGGRLRPCLKSHGCTNKVLLHSYAGANQPSGSRSSQPSIAHGGR